MEKMKIRFTYEDTITSDDDFFKNEHFNAAAFRNDDKIRRALENKEGILNSLKCAEVRIVDKKFIEISSPHFWQCIIKYEAISEIYICVKIIDEIKFICHLDGVNQELFTVYKKRGFKIFSV
jgi:hypothetical protein